MAVESNRQNTKGVIKVWSFIPGDYVLNYDHRGVRWKGVVDVTSPELGVLWIRTFTGERKLLDIRHDKVLRISGPNDSV